MGTDPFKDQPEVKIKAGDIKKQEGRSPLEKRCKAKFPKSET